MGRVSDCRIGCVFVMRSRVKLWCSWRTNEETQKEWRSRECELRVKKELAKSSGRGWVFWVVWGYGFRVIVRKIRASDNVHHKLGNEFKFICYICKWEATSNKWYMSASKIYTGITAIESLFINYLMIWRHYIFLMHPSLSLKYKLYNLLMPIII